MQLEDLIFFSLTFHMEIIGEPRWYGGVTGVVDWGGLGWNGLDWVGLGWTGLDWVGGHWSGQVVGGEGGEAQGGESGREVTAAARNGHMHIFKLHTSNISDTSGTRVLDGYTRP